MWDVGGYDKRKVEDLATTIQDTYEAVCDKIETKLNEDFITPMSTVWYAPEAKEYFEGVAQDVENMADTMRQAYSNYRDWIQAAGENWWENTKGSGGGGLKPELKTISDENITLSVKKIKESQGNTVKMDEQACYNIADRLDTIRTECLNIVKTEHAKLNASSAFLGHGQAQAANDCFVEVANAIDQLFKILSSFKDDLHKAAEKYKKVAENIANNLKNAKNTVQGN